MQTFSTLALLASSLFVSTSFADGTNARRGIVYMPHDGYTNDYQHWKAPLSWYYNYGTTAASELASTGMEFVPMLWGNKDGMTQNFIPNVKKLSNVKYALAMNEPDIIAAYGGSDMSASDAVTLWKQYIEPLAQTGIKLGTPAVSGSPNGFQWMQDFINQCSGCTIDFIALHYYGPSDGLASHLAQYNAKFPGKQLWLTEWADSNDSLDSTTTNTKAMMALLDSLSYVERYSYFGAVRSNVCNVGANAALMDTSGNLNALGQMYMSGGGSTTPVPTTSLDAVAPSSTSVAAPSSAPTAAAGKPPVVVPTTFATKVSTPITQTTSTRSNTVIKTFTTVVPTVHNISTASYVAPKNTSASHHHKHTHTRHYKHRYTVTASAAEMMVTASAPVVIVTQTVVQTKTAYGRYRR